MFPRRLAIVFFLTTLFAACTAGVAAPIPSGPDAPLSAVWSKQLVASQLRWVELYRKHTKDPEKARGPAIEFLTGRLRDLTFDPRTLEATYQQSRKVLAAGSKDPLVLNQSAWAAVLSKREDEGRPRFWQASKAADASTYPEEIKFLLHEGCRSYCYSINSFPFWREYHKAYIAHAVPWLIEQSGRGENPRFMWSLLSNFMDSQVGEETIGYQKEFFEALTAANGPLDAEPGKVEANGGKTPGERSFPKTGKIDPWIRNMVAGCYYRNLAWHYHAGDWGYTVTDDGGRPFREKMAVAEKHLAKAWGINPKLPAAAATMITVAMVTGGDTRLWFDRAVAAEMDYKPAYTNLAWFLRPRSGGSHAAMNKFGQECATTKRFDTDVPYVLVQTLMGIDGELGGKGDDWLGQGDVWRKRGVYESVKRVLDGMNQDPARADEMDVNFNHTWTMSLGAAIAIRAGKYADARQLLDRVGKRIRLEAFQQIGVAYPEDAARAYALSGSASEEVAAFEDLLKEKGLQDGEVRKTARKLIEAADAKNRDEAAKPYFYSRKTLLGWLDGYERGDWVDLQFDAKPLWDVRKGDWNLREKRAIVGRILFKQTVWHERLDCRAEFRVPVEFELDVQCLRQSAVYTRPKGPHAGLIVGCSSVSDEERATTGGGWLFWVNSALGTAGVTAPDQELHGANVAQAKSCHLCVQVWPGRYEYSVDGFGVAGSDEKDFTPDGSLGLGTATWLPDAGDVRYSNLRVRKLTAAPPPHDDEARLKYYSDLVRRRPAEGRPYLCRAVSNDRLQRFGDAAADYSKAAELDHRLRAAVVQAGLAEFKNGDYAMAEKQLELAVKTQPDSPLAWRALAWLRATCPEDKYRQGAAAVKQAQMACKLSKSADAGAFGALAAAEAETGNFPEAIKMGRKAVDLAADKEKAECRERLKLYADKKPCRQPRPAEKKS